MVNNQFTALDAHKYATEDISSLINEIKHECQQGANHLNFIGRISETQKKKLEDLGFKVKTDYHNFLSIRDEVTISW